MICWCQELNQGLFDGPLSFVLDCIVLQCTLSILSHLQKQKTQIEEKSNRKIKKKTSGFLVNKIGGLSAILFISQ